MIAAFHRAAALTALAFLAAGCANFSAISPGESALTVEARVGPPGTVWKNVDGSEVWEYPIGRAGGPPGAEGGVLLEDSRGNVPRRRAPAARQAEGSLVFSGARRRSVDLALSGSQLQVLQRPVRSHGRRGENHLASRRSFPPGRRAGQALSALMTVFPARIPSSPRGRA